MISRESEDVSLDISERSVRRQANALIVAPITESLNPNYLRYLSSCRESVEDVVAEIQGNHSREKQLAYYKKIGNLGHFLTYFVPLCFQGLEFKEDIRKNYLHMRSDCKGDDRHYQIRWHTTEGGWARFPSFIIERGSRKINDDNKAIEQILHLKSSELEKAIDALIAIKELPQDYRSLLGDVAAALSHAPSGFIWINAQFKNSTNELLDKVEDEDIKHILRVLLAAGHMPFMPDYALKRYGECKNIAQREFNKSDLKDSLIKIEAINDRFNELKGKLHGSAELVRKFIIDSPNLQFCRDVEALQDRLVEEIESAFSRERLESKDLAEIYKSLEIGYLFLPRVLEILKGKIEDYIAKNPESKVNGRHKDLKRFIDLNNGSFKSLSDSAIGFEPAAFVDSSNKFLDKVAPPRKVSLPVLIGGSAVLVAGVFEVWQLIARKNEQHTLVAPGNEGLLIELGHKEGELRILRKQKNAVDTEQESLSKDILRVEKEIRQLKDSLRAPVENNSISVKGILNRLHKGGCGDPGILVRGQEISIKDLESESSDSAPDLPITKPINTQTKEIQIGITALYEDIKESLDVFRNYESMIQSNPDYDSDDRERFDVSIQSFDRYKRLLQMIMAGQADVSELEWFMKRLDELTTINKSLLSDYGGVEAARIAALQGETASYQLLSPFLDHTHSAEREEKILEHLFWIGRYYAIGVTTEENFTPAEIVEKFADLNWLVKCAHISLDEAHFMNSQELQLMVAEVMHEAYRKGLDRNIKTSLQSIIAQIPQGELGQYFAEFEELKSQAWEARLAEGVESQDILRLRKLEYLETVSVKLTERLAAIRDPSNWSLDFEKSELVVRLETSKLLNGVLYIENRAKNAEPYVRLSDTETQVPVEALKNLAITMDVTVGNFQAMQLAHSISINIREVISDATSQVIRDLKLFEQFDIKRFSMGSLAEPFDPLDQIGLPPPVPEPKMVEIIIAVSVKKPAWTFLGF